MIVFEHAHVINPDGPLEDQTVVTAEGKITAVGPAANLVVHPEARVVDLSGKRLLPGFIDVHIHGARGYQAMGSSLEDLIRVLPQFGVTSFLATTVTLPGPEIERRLGEMAEVLSDPPGGAEPLGIHLEGPHLSPARPGMANPAWFEPLTREGFDRLQEISGSNIRMITFAPEEGEAAQLIPYLRDSGVVPVIGHSNASYEMVLDAVERGLDHAAHTFNAMPPFHHRRPGVIGAVLASDKITAQLIADGIHVHPGAMRALLNAKGPERVCLISDAAPFAGCPEGEYAWDSYQVVIKEGAIRSPQGTLAGAYQLMDQGLCNLVQQVGLSLEDASLTASLVPARSLGVDHRKGKVEPSRDADLVVVDDDCRVVLTMGKGEILWERE